MVNVWGVGEHVLEERERQFCVMPHQERLKYALNRRFLLGCKVNVVSSGMNGFFRSSGSDCLVAWDMISIRG